MFIYAGRGLLTLQLRQFFRAEELLCNILLFFNYFYFFLLFSWGSARRERIKWGLARAGKSNSCRQGKVVRRSKNFCDLKSRSRWTLRHQHFLEIVEIWVVSGAPAVLSAVPENIWKMWKCSVLGEGNSRCSLGGNLPSNQPQSLPVPICPGGSLTVLCSFQTSLSLLFCF